jgi:hypothetical protein
LLLGALVGAAGEALGYALGAGQSDRFDWSNELDRVRLLAIDDPLREGAPTGAEEPGSAPRRAAV